ncbi:enoyl-CoA hydratase [Roseococcus sp. YIM B11640]|uniref:enoyl-CoA hydratase n=1 Tax=Roseococcus sp. YIM B11640 TaxID=3133973 RepID=UPI003C7A8CDD
MILEERRNDGVALITLDRAPARNALSIAMLDALSAALLRAEDARCVVLAANGPAFSAGHDLRELTAARAEADGGREFYARTMALCSRVMQQVVNHPVPVIAAVEGVATAAGCQLVASCDLAVATPHSRFCTPGVDIGLFCSTPAVAVARAVPRKAAMEMLLTGRMLGAEEAREIGLINRVAEDARTGALELAQQIAARSGLTIRMGKRGFLAQAAMPLAEAYDAASAVMVENMMAADAEEGIGAFLGKRAPQWQDR